MSSFVQIYERYINMVFEDEDQILIQTRRYDGVYKNNIGRPLLRIPDVPTYRINTCFYCLRFYDELKNITETEAEIDLILRDRPEILQKIPIIRNILFVTKNYFRTYIETEFLDTLNCKNNLYDLYIDDIPNLERIREIADPKERLKLLKKFIRYLMSFLSIFPLENTFKDYVDIFDEKWFGDLPELYACHNLDEYLRDFMGIFYGNISLDFEDDIMFYKRELLFQTLQSYIKKVHDFFDTTHRSNVLPDVYSAIILLQNYFDTPDQFITEQLWRLKSITYSPNYSRDVEDVISGIIEYIISLDYCGPVLK